MKMASAKQYIPLQTAMLRNFRSFLDLRAERLKSKLMYKPRVCKNHTFHAALIHKAYVWGVTTGNTENVIPISFTPREFQLLIVVYNWMTEKLTQKITIYRSQQKSLNCNVEPQTIISVKIVKKSGDFQYSRRIFVHVETWNEIIPNKRWNLWTLKGRPQIISNKAAKFCFHQTPTIDLIWAFTSPWRILEELGVSFQNLTVKI